jgi:hypothetical protein
MDHLTRDDYVELLVEQVLDAAHWEPVPLCDPCVELEREPPPPDDREVLETLAERARQRALLKASPWRRWLYGQKRPGPIGDLACAVLHDRHPRLPDDPRHFIRHLRQRGERGEVLEIGRRSLREFREFQRLLS